MSNEKDVQWEGLDYTDDNKNPGLYDSDNNVDSDEFNQDVDYEEDDESDVSPVTSNKKAPMLILLVLIIALIVVGVLVAMKLISGSKNSGAPDMPPSGVQAEQAGSDLQVDFPSDFFNDNAPNSDVLSVNFNEMGEGIISDNSNDGSVAKVAPDTSSDNAPVANVNPNNVAAAPVESSPKPQKNDDNMIEMTQTIENIQQADSADNPDNSIMVAWNKAARLNPFKSPVVAPVADKFEKFGDSQFEIIEPPVRLVSDYNLSKLLQTQISGILYDDESPSAIIKLSGKDEFVKIGDEVSGYKIKNITRNKVEISYKNNTYVASVGELFTPGSLETQSAVVNLNNKFAGRYNNN